MKKTFLICLLMLAGLAIDCRAEGPWTAFFNKDTGLKGFKDQNGHIQIEPRFISITPAKRFDRIIAVFEEKDSTLIRYYLTKTGEAVGSNNLYMFDNSPDCESEGFIRFRDKTTDKAGMYSGRGEIAIPPEYNDLTNVRNGLVAALNGAKKTFWDEEGHSGCEHFTWVGGTQYLIDTKNRIVIKDFQYSPGLNFFSLQIETSPSLDPNRKSFPGVDGRYYSFIDYEKEFKSWLHASILDSISLEKLISASYKHINIYKEPQGWTSESSAALLGRNLELIKRRLVGLKKESSEYFISLGGLNPFIYETPEFESYFNNCGDALEWKYPVLELVINHADGNDISQDIFEFLRTEQGYKLISITIGMGELK